MKAILYNCQITREKSCYKRCALVVGLFIRTKSTLRKLMKFQSRVRRMNSRSLQHVHAVCRICNELWEENKTLGSLFVDVGMCVQLGQVAAEKVWEALEEENLKALEEQNVETSGGTKRDRQGRPRRNVGSLQRLGGLAVDDEEEEEEDEDRSRKRVKLESL
jgi:hypothetical protein